MPAPGFMLAGRRATGQVLLLNSRSGQEYDAPGHNYTSKYGKFAYSTHFGRPPHKVAPHYVITSDAGLINPDELLSFARLKAFGDVPIDLLEPRYTEPLQASVAALKQNICEECEVVLLGSIATDKYVEILVQAFGPRLVFPREFIGRGDMSRGGLLLRAVKADSELEYVSLSAVESRRGKRPPKLPR